MIDKVGDIVERLREQHKYEIIGLPENWLYVHYGDAADLIQSQQALMEEMVKWLEYLPAHYSDEREQINALCDKVLTMVGNVK